MRQPNRLPPLYRELQRIHMKHPNLRFGQLFSGFNLWLLYVKHLDTFYIEDDKILKLFKEYIEEELT